MAKKKVKVEPIKTRHSEELLYTENSVDMFDKYIVKSVYREYEDDFLDEDTGEVVSITRNEILFNRGTRITHDILTEINFYILSKDITGVWVSNQQRAAYELDSTRMNVWVAKVEINAKGSKFIFYANNIANAIEIVKDYVEQKYDGGFNILECKEFVRSIIIEDNLESIEDTKETGGKKFFQIDTTVNFDDCETATTFIVHTISIEKAMLLIDRYINQKEDEASKENESKGVHYRIRTFKVGIDKAAPIPIGVFIPIQFSEAYCASDDNQ